MRRAATWVARVLGVAKGPQADGKGQCHLPCCLSSACAGSTSDLTGRPLLETPRLRPRQHGAPRRCGRGTPPPPFERVARWGAAHLRLLGCAARGSGLAAGGAGAVIASWQLQLQVLERGSCFSAAHPVGRRGLCACRGREHRSVTGTRPSLSQACLISFLVPRPAPHKHTGSHTTHPRARWHTARVSRIASRDLACSSLIPSSLLGAGAALSSSGGFKKRAQSYSPGRHAQTTDASRLLPGHGLPSVSLAYFFFCSSAPRRGFATPARR